MSAQQPEPTDDLLVIDLGVDRPPPGAGKTRHRARRPQAPRSAIAEGDTSQTDDGAPWILVVGPPRRRGAP